MLKNTFVSNYNIAMKNTGELFRIDKNIDYNDNISINEFVIIKRNNFTKYFDHNGFLLPQYWALPRIGV